MPHLHSSSRRPPALKDSDYDHEIFLIDTSESNPATNPDDPDTRSIGSQALLRAETAESERSDPQPRKKSHLRKDLAQRKYRKYQDRPKDADDTSKQPDESITPVVSDSATAEPDIERGRSKSTPSSRRKNDKKRQSATDVLFENQRGGFLCGIPLFSSKALGAADAPPWTNIAQKPSATSIANAQPPDPLWEWAWKEWKINHSEYVDEDGWEYSFMFSKKFSWHGPTWYNSYVRRRAWIRKRVKQEPSYRVQEAHMLNADYFTIHPNIARSRSTSKAGSARYSVGALARREMEELGEQEEIRDIGHLMKVLKLCRIDREKIEAVENFIEHADDDIFYLDERMHDVMSQFIFQTSRRLLLSHLSQKLNHLVNQEEQAKDGDDKGTSATQMVEWLEAAVRSADEAAKKLSFWSDIRDMAERGETKGAVDESQGWDKSWTGLDNSAPQDVISDRGLLKTEENGYEKPDGSSRNGHGDAAQLEKGKGKA